MNIDANVPRVPKMRKRGFIVFGKHKVPLRICRSQSVLELEMDSLETAQEAGSPEP